MYGLKKLMYRINELKKNIVSSSSKRYIFSVLIYLLFEVIRLFLFLKNLYILKINIYVTKLIFPFQLKERKINIFSFTKTANM